MWPYSAALFLNLYTVKIRSLWLIAFGFFLLLLSAMASTGCGAAGACPWPRDCLCCCRPCGRPSVRVKGSARSAVPSTKPDFRPENRGQRAIKEGRFHERNSRSCCPLCGQTSRPRQPRTPEKRSQTTPQDHAVTDF